MSHGGAVPPGGGCFTGAVVAGVAGRMGDGMERALGYGFVCPAAGTSLRRRLEPVAAGGGPGRARRGAASRERPCRLCLAAIPDGRPRWLWPTGLTGRKAVRIRSAASPPPGTRLSWRLPWPWAGGRGPASWACKWGRTRGTGMGRRGMPCGGGCCRAARTWSVWTAPSEGRPALPGTLWAASPRGLWKGWRRCSGPCSSWRRRCRRRSGRVPPAMVRRLRCAPPSGSASCSFGATFARVQAQLVYFACPGSAARRLHRVGRRLSRFPRVPVRRIDRGAVAPCGRLRTRCLSRRRHRYRHRYGPRY